MDRRTFMNATAIACASPAIALQAPQSTAVIEMTLDELIDLDEDTLGCINGAKIHISGPGQHSGKTLFGYPTS